QRQHLAADAAGVELVDVDADAARADVDARDAEVEDLLQPFGAVLRAAHDAEAVDELGLDGSARVEVQLAGPAALHAGGAAAAGAQYALHRVQRPLDPALIAAGDLL